jgi:hypothetical protein
MASGDSLQRQPTPAQRSVAGNSFQRVGGTTWGKTALAGRANKESLRWRKRPAIQPNAEQQNVLRRVHNGVGPFNKPAFCSVDKKSCSTSANPLPTMEGRATKTNSTVCSKSCWCNRKVSRNNRRARFRETAPPIFPAVITPRREFVSPGRRRQFAIRQPLASRSPCRRTRAKSRLCLSRAARPSLSPFGVPRPMRLVGLRPGSSVCAPFGAGCARSLGRSCSNCGSRTRAAVCGESSTVDIVAS